MYVACDTSHDGIYLCFFQHVKNVYEETSEERLKGIQHT